MMLNHFNLLVWKLSISTEFDKVNLPEWDHMFSSILVQKWPQQKQEICFAIISNEYKGFFLGVVTRVSTLEWYLCNWNISPKYPSLQHPWCAFPYFAGQQWRIFILWKIIKTFQSDFYKFSLYCTLNYAWLFKHQRFQSKMVMFFVIKKIKTCDIIFYVLYIF